MNAEDLIFLDFDDVLELHAMQLEEFGGRQGYETVGYSSRRSRSLKHRLVASTFMTACFRWQARFHIVSNHPFVDCNKRAGVLSALVFLDVNGVAIGQASDAL